MTGHGQSQLQVEGYSVDCEIRAVNNRYLKCHIYWPDQFSRFEVPIQNLVRKYAKRGTITLTFRYQANNGTVQYSLNKSQLQNYLTEVREFDPTFFERVQSEAFLGLPGVVSESDQGTEDVDSLWPMFEQVTEDALRSLMEMRANEGAVMARDLLSQIETIEANLADIGNRSPRVVEDYARRLLEKINEWLQPYSAQISNSDIIREVGLFADRSDISEEIVRLGSHIKQFRDGLDSSRADGRKLEFVTQEILRETNTIGSKANDSEIGRHVVEIKTAIERIREMVQNIE